MERSHRILADGVELAVCRSDQFKTGLFSVTLAAPLRKGHSRSRPLLPAQHYRADADGQLSAVFQTACTVEVFAEEGGLLASLTLSPGENSQTLPL